MSPPFPLISHSPAFFSSTHLFFTFCVVCVSGPADLNLMSKCAPCLAAPCQNNGTCVSDVTGSYHCTCPFGYKVSEQPMAHIYHRVASILSSCTRVRNIQNIPLSYVHHYMQETLIIHLPKLNFLYLNFLISSYCTQGRCLWGDVCVADSAGTVWPWGWSLGPHCKRCEECELLSKAIYFETRSHEKWEVWQGVYKNANLTASSSSLPWAKTNCFYKRTIVLLNQILDHLFKQIGLQIYQKPLEQLRKTKWTTFWHPTDSVPHKKYFENVCVCPDCGVKSLPFCLVMGFLSVLFCWRTDKSLTLRPLQDRTNGLSFN